MSGNLLVDLLTLPVLGVPRAVCWVAGKIVDAAEQEAFDEGKLQGQLLDLQIRYEVGEIDDRGYSEQETAILEKLSAVRKAKEQAEWPGKKEMGG